MKRLFFSILLTIFALLSVRAADNFKRYSLNIKDFAELKVVGSINVVHHCNADSAGIVSFIAPEEMSHLILFSNNNNKLKIELTTDGAPITGLPTVHVYSTFISNVENSGDSTVTVANPVPASSFKARIIGNGALIAHNLHATQVTGKIDTGCGHMVLNGKASESKLNNTGKGRLEAGNLICEEVKITVLGTGPIDCYATEKVTVKGLGSSHIYVKGNPKEIVNRSIGAKVELVD